MELNRKRSPRRKKIKKKILFSKASESAFTGFWNMSLMLSSRVSCESGYILFVWFILVLKFLSFVFSLLVTGLSQEWSIVHVLRPLSVCCGVLAVAMCSCATKRSIPSYVTQSLWVMRVYSSWVYTQTEHDVLVSSLWQYQLWSWGSPQAQDQLCSVCWSNILMPVY